MVVRAMRLLGVVATLALLLAMSVPAGSIAAAPPSSPPARPPISPTPSPPARVRLPL